MLDDLIRKVIREMVGGSGPPTAFLTPKGDPGLFGPESITWKVHEDFIAMMIGGISSLILQALHPQALAGVWDHSTFRKDLKGRLGRTAYFIAATTYGSTDMAETIIRKVNTIHSKVAGIDEFGKPYDATDPHLLAWVHLTETFSFMNAYEDYRNEALSTKQRDQYFHEMRSLGYRLGATHLPDTYEGTKQAIYAYLPELHYGERAKSVIHLLENFPSQLIAKPFITLLSRAGFNNLPNWVYPIIQKTGPNEMERFAVKKSINLLAIPVREALKNGVAAHSRKRMYGE
jgi:uncharacterized protein (DUF2236 family)